MLGAHRSVKTRIRTAQDGDNISPTVTAPLTGRLDAQRAEFDTFASVVGRGPSPLEILLQISAATPVSLKIKISELSVAGRLVYLKGHTDSFKAVDALRGALQALPIFSAVEIQDAGIETLVTICTRIRNFEQVHAIAKAHDNVFCSVGTHPHNADEERDIPLDDILTLAQHPEVVAIGEAGLDYHYDNAPRADQQQGFRTHIAAARETGLPLVIHTRDADEDTADILEQEMAKGPFSAVLHCFTAGAGLASRGLELGFYVSFSGVLTFKKSDALREIAANVPLDRLLVETDAPYLSPEPKRGAKNEPAKMIHTEAKLAEVKGVSLEEIAQATTANFHRLFASVPSPSGLAGQ